MFTQLSLDAYAVSGTASTGLRAPIPAHDRRGMRPSETLRHCFTEARPCVQAVFLVRFLVGVTLSHRALTIAEAPKLLLGAASWVCAIMFVYLFNGASDTVEDRADGKNRPIARGDLPAPTALRVGWLFAAAGLTGALALGSAFTVLVVAITGLGYLYSAPGIAFKRHYLGAGVVAGLGGALTLAAGCILAGGTLDSPELALLATIMAAWMGCVGSVAKDFSDVRGDAAAGRRTLVLVLGERAGRIAVSAAALGVAGTFAAVALSWVAPLVFPALLMLAGSFYVAWSALRGAGDARRPYRAFMVTQYGGLAATVICCAG